MKFLFKNNDKWIKENIIFKVLWPSPEAWTLDTATAYCSLDPVFKSVKILWFFRGLFRISELYWAKQEACCLMKLAEENIWKTHLQCLAPGLHPKKFWRSTLRTLIQRKNFKTQLLLSLTFNFCNSTMIAVFWLWSCVNISIP